MQRLIFAAAAALFAVLAHAAAPHQGYWLPPSPDAWERVQQTGVQLTRGDGTAVRVPPDVVQNLVAVRRLAEKLSGLTVPLAVVDEPVPRAFATTRGGAPIIGVTARYIETMAADREAVAMTMFHEYAHIKLGHTGKTRQDLEREAGGFIPIIGGLFVRAYARDHERAADALALQWAIEAGYSPCAVVREMNRYKALGMGGTGSFLATHPGVEERIDTARAAAQQRGETCEGHEPVTSVGP